jgi:hypothetical protein
VEQPATTAKHDARVEQNREKMEKRRADEQSKFQEDVERYIKQNRLVKRVKCSPALVSNGLTLAKKKQEAQAKARRMMREQQQAYDLKKAEIEYNVANRPLLVEQVSKAFIHNLN